MYIAHSCIWQSELNSNEESLICISLLVPHTPLLKFHILTPPETSHAAVFYVCCFNFHGYQAYVVLISYTGTSVFM